MTLPTKKKMDNAIRESEEQYRRVLESVDSAVVIVDRNGKFQYVNPRAEHDLGGEKSWVSRSIYDAMPEPLSSEQIENLEKVFRDDKPLVVEEYLTVSGKRELHRTSIQPLHDECGKVANVLITSVGLQTPNVPQTNEKG